MQTERIRKDYVLFREFDSSERRNRNLRIHKTDRCTPQCQQGFHLTISIDFNGVRCNSFVSRRIRFKKSGTKKEVENDLFKFSGSPNSWKLQPEF